MFELTQEIVRELLDYDPKTGVFTWKERGVKWFPEDDFRSASHNANIWNVRYAHQIAGTTSNGYTMISILHHDFSAHRLAWLYMTGEWPKNHIDHKNGVRDDNRWMNLREVTRVENNRNAKLRADNTSGYKGVCFDKACKKWNARIWKVVDGKRKRVFLGYFDTSELAFQAYVKEAKALGFSKRHINE